MWKPSRASLPFATEGASFRSESPGEVTSGIRSVLSNPRLYDLMQNVLGGSHARRTLAPRYIRAKPGDKVVDMGYGTPDILGFLPDGKYVGFDTSLAYIEATRLRFGERGEFRDELWSTRCNCRTADSISSWH